MRILLLSGGNSNEREVSIRSGRAVATAVKELGHDLIEADPASKDFRLEENYQGIDLVFPVLHGAGGEDGVIQKQLEKLGVKFVGSGSTASKLCFDKWAYKELLLADNLPASAGRLVTNNDLDDEYFKGPFVLKPVEGGSSLDTLIARQPGEDSMNQAEQLLNRYESMLLEPIIDGTEVTVGILGDEALPIIEIVPPEGLEFDYENKYNGATRELCPPETVSEELQKQAQELALKIHRLTGCSAMSRTDIIIDNDNKLHVLETNTIPGMTEQSLYPKMGRTAGYEWIDFIGKLISLSVNG